MPLHSSASGTDLHEALREKAPVRAASTVAVTLATPGTSIDGVTLVSGDRVLLKNQAAPAENGIYVWSGAATLLVRSLDALSAADFVYGFKVYVREGSTNTATHWVFSQTTAVTLGTTELTFVGIGTGSGPAGPPGAAGIQGLPGTFTVSITGAPPYICIQDQKPSGTLGGSTTTGSWQTHTLNTVVANDLNIAVLDRVTSRITLPAGTYRANCFTVGYATGHFQARLAVVPNAIGILVGTDADTNNANSITALSIVSGRFSLGSPTAIELQMRTSASRSNDGYGNAGSWGVEIYATAEFWLEAGPPPFFGVTIENPNLDKNLAKRFDAMTSVMMIGQQSKANLPFVTIGTTTSITNSVGTTAVYTFAAPPAVTTGQAVTVTGATPSVYNVSARLVTNVAGNTFSVDIGSSGNGAASVQGTAVQL